MIEFVLFLGLCFVLGGVGSCILPLPLLRGAGLVAAAAAGRGWLVSLGVSFVSLVLVMVYLGRMLVVFVNSMSLAADPY
ncbi:NU6M oxidoreductase, partial [Molothrus ater]|nr:NU6M oxidoreductase [Molothrus ater]